MAAELPRQRLQRTLRQTALPHENSFRAKGARKGQQEAKRGAAFTAGQHACFRRHAANRCNRKHSRFRLPDPGAQCTQAVDSGLYITGKLTAGNTSLPRSRGCTNQQTVGMGFGSWDLYASAAGAGGKRNIHLAPPSRSHSGSSFTGTGMIRQRPIVSGTTR